MHGSNPIRQPVKGDGTTLDVVNIFPTIQGEGPFAGQPAVFIRLSGCNLACDFCDTEFEVFNSMHIDTIVEEIVALAGEHKHLVVITGGEPLRQPIELLCQTLLERGLTVQIETNGTLYRPLDERVHIVCSPKTTTGRYARVREDLLPHIDALKFVVAADHALYRDIQEVGQSDYGIPVYVQPMDEHDDARNHANRRYAATIAEENGYHLSLQLHKILGIA